MRFRTQSQWMIAIFASRFWIPQADSKVSFERTVLSALPQGQRVLLVGNGYTLAKIRQTGLNQFSWGFPQQRNGSNSCSPWLSFPLVSPVSGSCIEAKRGFVYCSLPCQLSTFHLLYHRDSKNQGLSNLSCFSSKLTRLTSVFVDCRNPYSGGVEGYVFLSVPLKGWHSREEFFFLAWSHHPAFAKGRMPGNHCSLSCQSLLGLTECAGDCDSCLLGTWLCSTSYQTQQVFGYCHSGMDSCLFL